MGYRVSTWCIVDAKGEWYKYTKPHRSSATVELDTLWNDESE